MVWPWSVPGLPVFRMTTWPFRLMNPDLVVKDSGTFTFRYFFQRSFAIDLNLLTARAPRSLRDFEPGAESASISPRSTSSRRWTGC